MSQPIISISNFAKSFGTKPVITDLSFEVQPGEIFAFLGANGSGKTTTIRCLLNIYAADAGSLLINGEPYSQSSSHILGYLPEERGLYNTSRVLETLVYFGQIKGMTEAAARSAAASYLDRVGLADKATSEIKSLSSGQQQKIQLGVTIINQPKLLILDEPTKGLDPLNRNLLLEILFELNKSGSTILFSTHQMEEAEQIAGRLLMLKNGTAALYGEVDTIKRSYRSGQIDVEFSGQFPRSVNSDSLFTSQVEAHTAKLIPLSGVSSTQILKHLVEADVQITKFALSTPSLNDIFIQVSADADAAA